MDGYEYIQWFSKVLSGNDFESLSTRAVSFSLSISSVTWSETEAPAGVQYMLN